MPSRPACPRCSRCGRLPLHVENGLLDSMKGIEPVKRMIFVLGVLLGVLLAWAGPAAAEFDWPQWRGPNGDGISQETDWNAAAVKAPANITWQKKIGSGYSAVSIAGNGLYAMGNSGDEDTVFCLDPETGATRWEHSYACAGGSYPGPRATPLVDGGLVYTVSRQALVLCLDATSGAVKWQRDLGAEQGARAPKWGHAASPVIEGNMLLLNACVSGVALDKKTGATIWASERGICGYASPVVFDAGGRRVAALFGESHLYGVDVKDGRQLWKHEWRTRYDVNASDPLVHDGKVFISSGYGRGCALVDVTRPQPVALWENTELRSQFSSFVSIGGYLYGMDGNVGRGSLRCLDLKDGTLKWSEDLGFGALTVAGDKLVVLNESGTLFVADVSPDAYHQLGRAQVLKSPKCWTAPVLCRGRIYCRNDKGDLVCVDVRR